MTDHWCTYCQGVNAHNCQFNSNLPRTKSYTTNTIAISDDEALLRQALEALKAENEKLRAEVADAAQRPADDEVVFIDGVGAGRSSIAHCRGGVQWIRVGDRVYWPLSDADAQRLQSACCGNGHFDGPTTPAVEGVNNG